MIKIKEAVIVEGKYDKIRLSNFIDGLIITTDGFGIFKDKEKQRLIKHLADTRGILILTDSDGAGFVIRNFLKGAVSPDKIKHAYIPDILGKEKRKDKPSKEGKLGVEGISDEIIMKITKWKTTICQTRKSWLSSWRRYANWGTSAWTAKHLQWRKRPSISRLRRFSRL